MKLINIINLNLKAKQKRKDNKKNKKEYPNEIRYDRTD